MPTLTDEIRTHAATVSALRSGADERNLPSSLDRFAQNAWPFPLTVLVGYILLRSVCQALVKPLWFDEICTSIMVRQKDISTLWKALQSGADSQPLPFYLIERAASGLLSNENLALRGISILAFACTVVCLFLLFRKWCGNLNALLCATIPLASVLFDVYSTEARGYSLVLACLAFALICYQKAPARLWTVLLAVGLVTAEFFHTYALFAFLPFLMAEAVFFLQTRRTRWPVWSALLTGFIPFLISWPMLSHIRTYYGKYVWGKPNIEEVWSYFGWYFRTDSDRGIVLLASAAVITLSGMLVAERRSKTSDDAPFRGSPLQNGVLILGFLILPFSIYAITKLSNGVEAGRHTLPAVLGFSMAAAYGLSMLKKPALRTGMSVLLAAVILSVIVPREHEFWQSNKASFVSPSDSVKNLAAGAGHSDLPIVISDQLEYLQLDHYATEAWRERFVSLYDPPNAVKFLGHDTLDRNVMILSHWTPLHVYDFSTFAAEHPVFLVYASNGGLDRDWWPGRLKKDGYTLKPVSVRDYMHAIFLASRPAIKRAN